LCTRKDDGEDFGASVFLAKNSQVCGQLNDSEPGGVEHADITVAVRFAVKCISLSKDYPVILRGARLGFKARDGFSSTAREMKTSATRRRVGRNGVPKWTMRTSVSELYSDATGWWSIESFAGSITFVESRGQCLWNAF